MGDSWFAGTHSMMITRTQKEEEEVMEDRKSLFHLMQIVTHQLYRTRSLQVAFSSDRIDIHDTLLSHVEKVRR